ncbi:tautomerase family protein [Nocardia iowensis]|uniref:Tautomerase family protein n=1 Tax=Nocardia iowensis TaxID=204891 RepID=A0ABX8RH89_NOCIO|nr:tautomerase family protein [Nocardia iowensis]QXN88706.1 tautomerase family protein [Nocardia iowensis]
MPFYSCRIPARSLNPAQKQAIAELITTVHAETFNAPPSFVRVMFHEAAPGDSFHESRSADFVFVEGHIRAGRDIAHKQRCLAGIYDGWKTIDPGVPDIEIILLDAPAAAMMGNGEIPPEPGQESSELLPSHTP